MPVEVRREKARVTREPVEGTVGDEEIGDEAIEVTLREEEPVIEKQTVAKERIRIEKDVETDIETVTGELRKERVGVERDAVKERRGSEGAAGGSGGRTTAKANPIKVQTFLEAVDYPTRKADLVRAAARQGAPE